MKTYNPEDPRWTAYVLNELEPSELEQVEREFAEDPDLKAFVEELYETAARMAAHFAAESSVAGLDELQRERIQTECRVRAGRIPRHSRAGWMMGIAAAATICLLSAWFAFYPPRRSSKPVDDLAAESVETESASPDMESVVAEAEPADIDGMLAQMERSLVAGDYDRVTNVGEQILRQDRYNRDTLRLLEQSAEARWQDLRVERRSSIRSSSSESEKHGSVGGQTSGEIQELEGLLSDISSPAEMTGVMAGSVSLRQAYSGGTLRLEPPAPPPVISPSLDDFDVLPPSDFRRVADHPLSTFSIDVDTASYTVVRRMLREGRLPPPDAVRVEEMINFFQYDYAPPEDGRPFAAHLSWADFTRSTWGSALVRIAVKGHEIPLEERPGLNLVFLIDVSGSMNRPNRLPLVKRSMEALVRQLDERDHVAIVVYAGQSGLALPPTSGADPQPILDALAKLRASGSTAGGAGIQLAYQTAREHFDPERVNRVILCTDGDFNVGITSRGELERLIEEEAQSGVFLSVLGFGMGNYKDSTLEILSNKGNGNYAYIDDFSEARRVLVDRMLGTLVTIAKDVKLQVEFNPARVAAYRLVGYENRMLRKEDFNNDKVDAGEIGAGHTVTALYEVIPVGWPIPGDAVPPVDPLRYQAPRVEAGESREILNLKIRYKEPDGEVSKLLEFPLDAERVEPDADFRFAAAVAGFGKALRDPAFAERVPLTHSLELAEGARGDDPGGYRAELIQLIRNAMALQE